MKQNFNDCLNLLLKDEGGYTNDPNDSGGPTNFGITLTDYRKYIASQGTAEDVRRMSVDDAKSIYKSKYWDALSCDTLPSGIDYTAFDYGVNSGLARPRKVLQQFSNLSGVALIDAINNERSSFLRNLATAQPKDQKFLRGWLARVERVRSFSKQLASKNTTVGPIAGTATAGTIAASAYAGSFWHNHEALLVFGGVGLAVVIGLVVHYLINKGKP